MLKPLDHIGPLDSRNEFPVETAVKPSRPQSFRKLVVMENEQFCKCEECGDLMDADRWTFP